MKKIFLFTGTAIIIVCFVLVLLIPSFLSSPFVLEKAIIHINQKGTGSLAVQDCSIGWFQGLVCNEVEYKDCGIGFSLNIEKISGDRGFLALIAAPKNPGVIHAYQPVLELTEHPDDSHLPTERNERFKEKENLSRGEVGKVPFWEKYIVRLVVEDGRFIFRSSESPGTDSSPLTAEFSLAASLSSGTVKYEFKWSGGKEGGTMTAEGVVNLPARKATFFETIVARSEVRIEQLQLAPFLALASLGTDIPSGSALVDGSFTVAGAGLAQLDLFGYLNVIDLKFKDGLAGDGYGDLGWLNIRFDGGRGNGVDWFCNELIVESEYGELTAKGKLSTLTGEVDLTSSLQIFENQTVAGQVDLRAAGFYTHSRLMFRDIDAHIRDFMFVGSDGLKIEQNELVIRTINPEIDGGSPITIQEIEISASMEEWQRRGGGLSGYDWQEKRLFVGDLEMDGELRAESIFSRIHPLFGTLTTATGRLGLRLDELYWPVIAGGENEALFTVVLDADRVHFDSKDGLTEVLNSLGISEQSLELKGNEIFCKGEGGRIACFPVLIYAGNSEITISGSTGMDKSLDYLLEISAEEGSPVLPENPLRGTDFRFQVTGFIEQGAVFEQL